MLRQYLPPLVRIAREQTIALRKMIKKLADYGGIEKRAAFVHDQCRYFPQGIVRLCEVDIWLTGNDLDVNKVD